MKKWRCKVCNYIHTGETPPKECPICGASADEFVLIEESDNENNNQNIQKVLFNISYGLYVITSHKDDKINGMTSNSFVQMTSTPMQAVVGINKNNLTSEYILDSKVFAVNFIGNNNVFEVKRFGYNSGRNFNKFKNINYKSSEITNCPLLLNTIGYVDCEIIEDKCVDLGTHTLFVAKVIGGEIFNEDVPMTYAHYRTIK
ncbi:MAG: flavin reductase [Eubacteriaceae bacterium]